ncbi:MAG: hypothetical protein COV46_08080 [Deltaproteobacteria bacterium CG11_big_fil_rev_8_21_14_0_20_49_13]|nr:MAG: hypothetical protein COV46_08080 [Deltaproteobacteria bacterium CG11_big_fil_rev_8_21_14_0_20_49_13]
MQSGISRSKIIFEVGLTTVLLIVFARFLYSSQNVPFVGKYYATIFAVSFLYVPVMVLWLRKRPIDFLDNSFGMFLKGVVYFIVTALIVYPPYLLCAHFWMTWVYGHQNFVIAPFPDIWKIAVFQVLLVALPEEFFFRGYMQTTLDRVFPKKWRILGANLGWAWIITCAVFAFSHSFVHYAWWHFSIFFPALLFGWLREKTGSITAPVLFHALANVASDWINRSYF